MLWTQVCPTKITKHFRNWIKSEFIELLEEFALFSLLLLLCLSLLDFVIVQYVYVVEYVLYTSEYTQLNGIRRYCAPFVADINVRSLLDTDTDRSVFCPLHSIRFVFVQFQPITIFQLIRFYEPFCSFRLLSFSLCVCVCRWSLCLFGVLVLVLVMAYTLYSPLRHWVISHSLDAEFNLVYKVEMCWALHRKRHIKWNAKGCLSTCLPKVYCLVLTSFHFIFLSLSFSHSNFAFCFVCCLRCVYALRIRLWLLLLPW